jgi:hypothetical protein
MSKFSMVQMFSSYSVQFTRSIQMVSFIMINDMDHDDVARIIWSLRQSGASTHFIPHAQLTNRSVAK